MRRRGLRLLLLPLLVVVVVVAEQSCTLDFHAVGVPYPCGRPNLRAVLEALLWVGPTLRKGPFEGRQADVWHFAFVVSETRRGRLVLTGR